MKSQTVADMIYCNDAFRGNPLNIQVGIAMDDINSPVEEKDWDTLTAE